MKKNEEEKNTCLPSIGHSVLTKKLNKKITLSSDEKESEPMPEKLPNQITNHIKVPLANL